MGQKAGFALFGSVVLALGITCLGSLASCSAENPASPSAPPAKAAAPLSFYKDVQPIIEQHCQGCHTQGGIAPFALLTYDDVTANADDIVAQTGQRAMPPWGAQQDESCTPPFPWKNDPSLTPAQIETLATWVGNGMIEGNPADAPPTTVQQVASSLPGSTMQLTPQAPYTVTDPDQDDFECFVLDPKIASTMYVNGSFVVPGNKTIVHHALVFTDPKRESLAKAGPNGSYPCFSDPGVSGEELVAAWAPGGDPIEFPSNVGLEVDPGTLFVMQVHYHPHSATASLAPDLTALQLRFTPAVPEYFMMIGLIGNFSKPMTNGTGLVPYPNTDGSDPNKFLIPANSTNHVQEMQFTVPPEVNGQGLPSQVFLYGVAGHMHYVGTDIQLNVHHTTANDQPDACLLHIPQWDFNWQRFYMYDTDLTNLPSVRPFDQVTVKCTYNNSMSNQFERESLLSQGLSQPEDVVLGETTLDEMCLGGFALVYKPVVAAAPASP